MQIWQGTLQWKQTVSDNEKLIFNMNQSTAPSGKLNKQVHCPCGNTKTFWWLLKGWACLFAVITKACSFLYSSWFYPQMINLFIVGTKYLSIYLKECNTAINTLVTEVKISKLKVIIISIDFIIIISFLRALLVNWSACDYPLLWRKCK